MTTRTIIEIDHDKLDDIRVTDISALLIALMGNRVAADLASGQPVEWVPGVRVLEQRAGNLELEFQS